MNIRHVFIACLFFVTTASFAADNVQQNTQDLPEENPYLLLAFTKNNKHLFNAANKTNSLKSKQKPPTQDEIEKLYSILSNIGALETSLGQEICKHRALLTASDSKKR